MKPSAVMERVLELLSDARHDNTDGLGLDVFPGDLPLNDEQRGGVPRRFRVVAGALSILKRRGWVQQVDRRAVTPELPGVEPWIIVVWRRIR